MTPDKIILLTVFIPVLGSLLLPVVDYLFPAKTGASRSGPLLLILVLSSMVLSFMLIPDALSGIKAAVSMSTLPGTGIFHADMLAVYAAAVSSLMCAITIFYSLGFMRDLPHGPDYNLYIGLSIGSALGSIFSGNLIILYVFWEFSTFACYRLVCLHREDSGVSRPDKFFLVNMFGSAFLLIGIFAVYNQTGSFDFPVSKANLMVTPLSNFAVFCILTGIFSKSAVFPFHTWLPDAGLSPIPVTALIHTTILTKIGVYVYARIFVAAFSIDPIWGNVVPLIAGVSALLAAGVALVETDMRRILSYGTISQTGFIFLGFSTGNGIGIAGGLLFYLLSALSSAGLLLCSGIIERNARSLDITRLGGLFETMPITGVSFLLCAFSLIGIPPLGGFFSQYLVISGASLEHSLITVLFGLIILINCIFILRLFSKVFLGVAKAGPVSEGSASMVGSILFLAILSVAGGLLIRFPSELVRVAVNQMLGLQ